MWGVYVGVYVNGKWIIVKCFKNIHMPWPLDYILKDIVPLLNIMNDNGGSMMQKW